MDNFKIWVDQVRTNPNVKLDSVVEPNLIQYPIRRGVPDRINAYLCKKKLKN